MAYEPLTEKEKKEIRKGSKCNIIEADFHQVTNMGQSTVVMSSHVNERKFTPIDYIDIYAKEKTKKVDHSIDVSDVLTGMGVNPNGFMIIVDVDKDRKLTSVELIRM